MPYPAVKSLQVSGFAGVLVTLEPLPFANAEGPLQLLSTGQQPAHHTQAAHHQAEAQAVIGQTSGGHSPAKLAAAPGKTAFVSLLKHSKQFERYTLHFLQPFEIQQQPAGISISGLTNTCAMYHAVSHMTSLHSIETLHLQCCGRPQPTCYI